MAPLQQTALHTLHTRTGLTEGDCEGIHESLREFLLAHMTAELRKFKTRTTEKRWRAMADEMRSHDDFPDLPDELSVATFKREYWYDFLRSPWVSAWTCLRRTDEKNGAPKHPIHHEETKRSTVTSSREEHTQSSSGTPSLEQHSTPLQQSEVTLPRDIKLQCLLMDTDKRSAPVNAIALIYDEKVRTDGTSVNVNVFDLSFLKFGQWVSAADQMSDADVNIMFYEDAQKNLVAIQSEEIFHMALIQMMYKRSRENSPNKTFQFIVMPKGNPDGRRLPIRSQSASQPPHQAQRGVKRRRENNDSPDHRHPQRSQSKDHTGINPAQGDGGISPPQFTIPTASNHPNGSDPERGESQDDINEGSENQESQEKGRRDGGAAQTYSPLEFELNSSTASRSPGSTPEDERTSSPKNGDTIPTATPSGQVTVPSIKHEITDICDSSNERKVGKHNTQEDRDRNKVLVKDEDEVDEDISLIPLDKQHMSRCFPNS